MLKNVLAWLTVSAGFAALNVIAAGALYAAFRALQWASPELAESRAVVILLALSVVIMVVWSVIRAGTIISRGPARGPARDRG